MATGDVTVFASALKEAFEGAIGDLNSDDIKIAFVNAIALPPDVDNDTPTWGGTGTVDYSGDEQSGGNVAAGGVALAGESAAQITGGMKFDSSDITINPNASNPATVRWGIAYNNTIASKRALFFLDFGATVTFVNGVVITVNAAGHFTVT